jgi:DNA-binding NarL/FixJ family response regulator
MKTETIPARVFVVDDHPAMRSVLNQIIGDAPGLASCGQAGSAEQALRMIPDANPDLALVDVSLPGQNGFELVTHLLARRPDLPILVYSSGETTAYQMEARRRGARGYVGKGDVNTLLAAIAAVLRGETYPKEPA